MSIFIRWFWGQGLGAQEIGKGKSVEGTLVRARADLSKRVRAKEGMG